MQPSVLIIDDDPSFLCDVEETLSQAGVGVVFAERMDQAIRLDPSVEFSMALIDIALAAAAGMSTVYQIKALLQDIPIIALSPSGDIDPAMAYEMGAIAVARKSAFRKLLFRYAGVGLGKSTTAFHTAGILDSPASLSGAPS